MHVLFLRLRLRQCDQLRHVQDQRRSAVAEDGRAGEDRDVGVQLRQRLDHGLVVADDLVGVTADKVYEVTEISQTDVQQTPRVGMHWKPEFIRFITKWREEFVIVPNMERILN